MPMSNAFATMLGDVCLAAIFGLVSFLFTRYRGHNIPMWKLVFIYFLFGQCLVLLGVMMLAVERGLDILESLLRIRAFYKWLASLVIVLGCGAWYFKKTCQGWYGFVEVLFAFVAALSIVRDMNEKSEYFAHGASLAGCVYIVSRGLSNIEKPLKRYLKRRMEIEKNGLATKPSKAVSADRLLPSDSQH